MIDSITIRNFKSIQELTLDLTYGEGKAPNGWKQSSWLPFIENGKAGRHVPVLAIYGANASGKSNVIKALAMLSSLLVNGIKGRYQPNRLVAEKQNAPAEFIVRLLIDRRRYLYELSYDKDQILRERLLETVAEGEFRTLFAIEDGKLREEGFANASYPLAKLDEICRVECFDEHERQTKTFLYGLFKGYAGLSRELNAVVNELVVKNLFCSNNDILLSVTIDRLVKAGIADNDQAAFVKIIHCLKKFDIHIENMTLSREAISSNSLEHVKEQIPPPGIIIRRDLDKEHVTIERITSFHQRTDGALEPFNFYADESEGTKLLAGLLGIVLEALENGKRLFIDELDRSLHPLLLVQIVRMFKSKKLNTKGAQLIFTLHETTLLEDPLLRLSEVGILNNNVFSGTTLARLVDYHKDDQMIRNVHNFRKRYLEGIYAGVPEPIL